MNIDRIRNAAISVRKTKDAIAQYYAKHRQQLKSRNLPDYYLNALADLQMDEEDAVEALAEVVLTELSIPSNVRRG